MSTSRVDNDKDIVIFMPPVDPDKPERPVDPVTGEINWDCPCMQGYVHGPCGDSFRTAYSCYIEASSSEDALDGCADKFRAMQACFDDYPQFYKDDGPAIEDKDDGDDDDEDNVDSQKDSSATDPKAEDPINSSTGVDQESDNAPQSPESSGINNVVD